MIEKISRSKSFVDQMRQEGKVTTFNRDEDIEVCNEMNESLEKFRREYQVKNRDTQMSASKLVLTR